ncbi:MAG: barnase inhibitor [Hydrogenophaga sp.]|nr:barstar family protein [Hydrogenophaga sp.]MBD3893051.1 barnase inhibitor [Hydrogenophaga sp.]
MDTPLRNVRPNIVQSIRAYSVKELQAAAEQLGHHFLYANLAKATSKQDVLERIGSQYTLPTHFGKNFDALYDCMTDLVNKSGQQTGFIVVLEHIPAHAKFDKEAREQLLDVFRDTADYWAERKIAFRCFYSFSVARTPKGEEPIAVASDDPMPTDKLLDVSPMALRMSSPFNAGYWTAAV